jgi:competence protein ComEC
MALAVLFCLAYIAGLVLASLSATAIALPWLCFGLCLLGVGLGASLGRRWRRGPTPWLWIAAGGLAALAAFYWYWQTPHPSPQDISHLLPRLEAMGARPAHLLPNGEADVNGTTDAGGLDGDATDFSLATRLTTVVEGPLIMAAPRLNRQLRGRFFLKAEQLTVVDGVGDITLQLTTQGRIYVTAPLLQVTGLRQGQRLRVAGTLYDPPTALNPNGFDFRRYLARYGTFTGLVAQTVTALEPAPGGLWQVRQRIVRSHVRALGSPRGQVVSAMALGRRAVDLPYSIQDLFTQVGLAHTVAASGFHVSLVLGAVLYGARARSTKLKVILGGLTLVLYLTLTGPQPSVLRAALMGAAALSALASDRAVNPFGALLTAVTLLLLVQPHWVSNVGFQLSVAATLGLLVSVAPLMARLPWLPTPVASAVAVPLAATLWVLPLLLYRFNTVAWVSVGLSALATPLVMVISLGGMVTGAVAMVAPTLASWFTVPLGMPVNALLWLARRAAELPGSAIALGQITLWQGALLYGGMGLVWRYPPARRHTLWLALGLTVLTLGPLGWAHLGQTRITLLAAGGDLSWVQQHRGRTTVISDGDAQTTFYTVLPFLRQAGINQVETAIAPRLREMLWTDWQPLQRQTPIRQFYSPAPDDPWGERSDDVPAQYQPLILGESTALSNLDVQLLGSQNPIFRLTVADQGWLFLPGLDLPTQDYLAQGATSVLASSVLVWPGDEVSETLLDVVQPSAALCYGRFLPEFVERQLQARGISVYWTERDGAIAWTPNQGFQGYLHQRQRPQILD